MFKFFLFVFFLLIGTVCLGQIFTDFSENTLPVKETISFRSVAALPNKNSLKVGVVSKILGVNQYYLTGTYSLGKPKKQLIGVQLHQKNRGDLISESSAKFLFKQSIELNRNNVISFATNLGVYQLFLKSTMTTLGASDHSLDLDLSASFKNHSWLVSVYQGNITQPQLRLFNEKLNYDRYIGIYTEKKFSFFSEKRSVAIFNVFRQSSFINWRSSFTQQVHNNILIGVNGSAYSLGLTAAYFNWEIHQNILGELYFGYSFPVSTTIAKSFTPFQIQVCVSGK